MDQATVQRLNELNTAFYLKFGESFDVSRSQPWEGWTQLMPYLQPLLNIDSIKILDLGCGNGRFFSFLSDVLHKQNSSTRIIYHGTDANSFLLSEAEKKLQSVEHKLFQHDLVTDLTSGTFTQKFSGETYDLVVAFGVLHHIPSAQMRTHFLNELHTLAASGGRVSISLWQFAQFMTEQTKQCQPESAHIQKSELEPGDYLLGWHSQLDTPRYCHSFETTEAMALAQDSGWDVQAHYAADGKQNSANLYLVLTHNQR